MSIRIGNHEWHTPEPFVAPDYGNNLFYGQLNYRGVMVPVSRIVEGLVKVEGEMPEIVYPGMPYVAKLKGSLAIASTGHYRAIRDDYTGYDIDAVLSNMGSVSVSVVSSQPVYCGTFSYPDTSYASKPAGFYNDSSLIAGAAAYYLSPFARGNGIGTCIETAVQWGTGYMLPQMFAMSGSSYVWRLTSDAASILAAARNGSKELKLIQTSHVEYENVPVNVWKRWIIGGPGPTGYKGVHLELTLPVERSHYQGNWYEDELVTQVMHIPFTEVVYSNTGPNGELLEEAPEEMRHATIGDL